MPDATQLAMVTAAQVCLDNAKIVLELRATAHLWPEGTEAHARVCLAKSEALLATLVRMYLRSLAERIPTDR